MMYEAMLFEGDGGAVGERTSLGGVRELFGALLPFPNRLHLRTAIFSRQPLRADFSHTWSAEKGRRHLNDQPRAVFGGLSSFEAWHNYSALPIHSPRECLGASL
jgi:hypothetical protein